MACTIRLAVENAKLEKPESEYHELRLARAMADGTIV
jgi:hypothetical protein